MCLGRLHQSHYTGSTVLWHHTVLTLNMLNWLKNYKRYIHVLIHILDLTWPKKMKLSLEQLYMLSVLHSQYHACWCTGDFRSQCISRHGIDPQSENIPSPASEEFIFQGRVLMTCCRTTTQQRDVWRRRQWAKCWKISLMSSGAWRPPHPIDSQNQ